MKARHTDVCLLSDPGSFSFFLFSLDNGILTISRVLPEKKKARHPLVQCCFSALSQEVVKSHLFVVTR